MKRKTQIMFIHGGMTFSKRKDYLEYISIAPSSLESTKYWTSDASEKLSRQFQFIQPRMPNATNAKYSDWKILFESYFSLLDDSIILIGESLGGTFLAKYLSENRFPRKILSVYLVCPPYDNSLFGEELVGGFRLKKNLSLIQKQTRNLYFMFSEDDDVVPIAHANKYRKALSDAKIIIYKSKNGHFKIERFPEIVKMIKEDVRFAKK